MTTYKAVCKELTSESQEPDDCSAITAIGIEGRFAEITHLSVDRIYEELVSNDETIVCEVNGEEHTLKPVHDGEYVRTKSSDTPDDPLLLLPACSDMSGTTTEVG